VIPKGIHWKGVRMRNRSCAKLALVWPFHRKWRYETSPVVTPKGVLLSEMRACATVSCTISALVGPFHWKWRHQASPVWLLLEVTWSEVSLGYSLGRPRPISSMATGTSPYHYLPLSRHFIFMGSTFNNNISYKSLLFSDMLCSTPSSLSRSHCGGY
jgi:hypothetical protein